MDLPDLARLVVGASAVGLLAVGLGVLAWEARQPPDEPVTRATGPLALVNFIGILGYVLVGLASAVTGLGLVGPLPAPWDGAARLIGIAAVMAAGLIAAWGLRSMGRDMSSRAEVRADTSLVTTGAFGMVRHPLYLSILLLWAGASVALLSWCMAGCAIILVPPLVARSRLEERLLVDTFGDAYRRYAERVPMLVPGFHGR